MWAVPFHGLDPALNEMKKEPSCRGGFSAVMDSNLELWD